MANVKADETRLYQQVGDQIRSARRARNLSQSELAQFVGMTRASIGNIEAGRQRIQLHTLAWIAFHLNADLHSLVPLSMETDCKYGAVPEDDAVFTDARAKNFVEMAVEQAERSG
ncbi:helix-turn-helix transcriptional regulator [Pseudonocardia nematodicida]|uniref:Helix-turn-helix transcriptional regulator n=1 Tax=Pseudonocardia nematodicida TaxID=1206997 RepID=A0ABV1KEK3_9PSEU